MGRGRRPLQRRDWSQSDWEVRRWPAADLRGRHQVEEGSGREGGRDLAKGKGRQHLKRE